MTPSTSARDRAASIITRAVRRVAGVKSAPKVLKRAKVNKRARDRRVDRKRDAHRVVTTKMGLDKELLRAFRNTTPYAAGQRERRIAANATRKIDRKRDAHRVVKTKMGLDRELLRHFRASTPYRSAHKALQAKKKSVRATKRTDLKRDAHRVVATKMGLDRELMRHFRALTPNRKVRADNLALKRGEKIIKYRIPKGKYGLGAFLRSPSKALGTEGPRSRIQALRIAYRSLTPGSRAKYLAKPRAPAKRSPSGFLKYAKQHYTRREGVRRSAAIKELRATYKAMNRAQKEQEGYIRVLSEAQRKARAQKAAQTRKMNKAGAKITNVGRGFLARLRAKKAKALAVAAAAKSATARVRRVASAVSAAPRRSARIAARS